MSKTRCLPLIALLTGLSIAGYGGAPADLGSDFSDAYAAFAPLYTAHRSYADYLFSGTEVTIPADLGDACVGFARELAQLQLDMVTQTESELAAPITYLARLRSDTALFCETYQPFLLAMTRSTDERMEAVQTASDAGAFAAIADLNRLFEGVLDATINAFEIDEEKWVFAVTFACRTFIVSPRIDRGRLDATGHSLRIFGVRNRGVRRSELGGECDGSPGFSWRTALVRG